MKNEAIYAESVREMIELNSYIIPYYNYEPRLHKPPVTYWAILLSVNIFGLNEFAVRLPSLVFGIFSAILTFLIAREFFSGKTAFFSFLAVGFSAQVVSNMRYASPEIPLLFFFTLTMYLFIKAYKYGGFYTYLFYISLGLTVLTKGYPYYIIIGFILFVFLVIDSNLNIRVFFNKIRELKVLKGSFIALLVGGWWYVYAYLDCGNWLFAVLFKETVERALGEGNFFEKLRPLYYIKTVLWGFLPYAFVFFLAFFLLIKENFRKFSFFFSWIIGMYIIFTLASGKIPTYFLQAFPALAIFSGFILANEDNLSGLKRTLLVLSLYLSTFYILAYLVYGMVGFGVSYLFVFLTFVPVVILTLLKHFEYIPLYSVVLFYTFLTVYLAPKIEKYRPYKEIGNIIKREVPDKTIPILVEDKSLNNLIFYAERKLLGKMTIEEMKKFSIPYVAIIYEKNIKQFKNKKVLWCGYIYKNRGDSRILTLVNYVMKAEKGYMSGFHRMCVIYKEWKNGRNYNP